MKLEFQVKAIPTLVGLGWISLIDNLHSSLSPTGLKSQEERQKEEICKFWDCESSNHYMLFVLYFIQCKKYTITSSIWSFSKNNLLSGPLLTFFCVHVRACVPGYSVVLQSGVRAHLCGFHSWRVSEILIDRLAVSVNICHWGCFNICLWLLLLLSGRILSCNIGVWLIWFSNILFM